MKKVILIGILLFTTLSLGAQPPIGKSMGRWTNLSRESMIENHRGGLDYIEVTINDFWRKTPNEVRERAASAKDDIEASGLKVWSVHLPFSRTLDISVLDSVARASNVAFIAEMMKMSAELFMPQLFVLHPSSEPITAEERQQRLRNSHASIGLLADVARELGITLCVENLPRTCLGQTGEEMLALIEGYPDVRLCLDTNHLFYQTHADYFKAVGKGLIATVHLSDYDFENECHWIPGKGQIDWAIIGKGLKKAGYKGIFMFECYGEPQELLDARDLIVTKSKRR